jgi:glycosyltransferase involved in cell wall biosynthesis
VFVSLSGYGLYARRAAAAQGALTVCNRGSAHILHVDAILAEEFALQGLDYKPIDPRLVRKELAEYAEADLIAVPSSFAYRSFVEHGVSERKLATIPYGVDLSLFKPVPKQDGVFRVLYVGTLSLTKGLPYLLEAFATLELPSFEVVLIGSVTREVEILMSKYEGGFRYLGFKPRTSLYQYYSQASVFVLPSVQDGFGQVLAQAMACGVPVISTTNTGGQDLFTDGIEGYVIPIRDVDALREKVLFLYHHPSVRDAMAAAALRRVKSLGGWDAFGDLAVQTYEKHLHSASVV